MDVKRQLQRFAPPVVARAAKRGGVHWRYRQQAAACRQGFATHGHLYRHPVLFVAGLPKSGTTWLEKMLGSYPGYHELLIPDVAAYELQTGGSHDYDLPSDMFTRFDEMLVLTKMHVHGSPHNARLLHAAQIPYVVLFRDLRDVAVSYHFYVGKTPWHPQHELYSDKPVQAGLHRFATDLLAEYAAWVVAWQQNYDAELGMIIQYEALLADTVGVMQQVAQHFGLDDSAETVQAIVDQHSFATLKQAQDGQEGFFRKGVAGDWRNHFTPELSDLYQEKIGRFLVDTGYEANLDW